MRGVDDALLKLTEMLEEMRADGRRHTEAIEAQRQAVEDERLAINQWNLRSERVMQDLLSGFQEVRAEIRESTTNIRAWRYEGVEEARAQRAALFAILDELKGRGGPATA
jgi:hypothetical protein